MKVTVKRESSGIKILSERIEELNKFQMVVGWFEHDKYPEEDGGESVSNVAATQEYGDPTKNIPPRPFVRPTMVRNKNRWNTLLKHLCTKIIKGELTSANAVSIFGEDVIGQLKESIVNVWSPPLSPITIALRLKKRADGKTVGNLTKPLIDSGFMIASIKALQVPKNGD